MSFFQTEKGKITTGVLAAVLATTAIMVPVSIFTDRAVRGDVDSVNTESIETYSYTATAGTTENGFGLVGIGNGDNYETVEWLNNNNAHYHDLLTDQEVIDGVVSNEGLAFGNRGIIGTEWDGYEAGKSSTKPLHLVDKVVDSETGEVTYNEVVTHEFDTPLSINMKVSKDAATVLSDHMYGSATGATPLKIEDLGEYGTEIVAHNNASLQQFAVAFGFFNYATYSDTAKSNLESLEYGTDGLIGGATASDLYDWFGTTFDAATWHTNEITGIFQLAVDGSSTVNPAFESVTTSINSDLTGTGISIKENLNNSGSSNSWGAPSEMITIPGTSLEGGSGTASAYTFLGTSSSLQSGYTNWGYSKGGVVKDSDFKTAVTTTGLEIADIATASTTPGSVLETTIAVDGAPTFYTSKDLKLSHTVETGETEEVDGEEVPVTETLSETPVAITRTGVYNAYVYGASWDALVASGELLFSTDDFTPAE